MRGGCRRPPPPTPRDRRTTPRPPRCTGRGPGTASGGRPPARQARPPSRSREVPAHRLDPRLERDVEYLDALPLPEPAVDLARPELDRPAAGRDSLLGPDLAEDHAQVPVAHRVAEEEQVALAQPPHQVRGQERAYALAGEVLDVVVLRDDERVALAVVAVDVAVDLQEHRALLEREVAVRCRVEDRHPVAVWAQVHEPLLVAPRLVDDDVDGLGRLGERALEHVVVVRRQDELAADPVSFVAELPRQLDEEAVQLVRCELAPDD